MKSDRAILRVPRVDSALGCLTIINKEYPIPIGYLSVLKTLHAIGYRLHLYYLWTPGCDLLFARIRQRVAAGGHTVPDQDVRRRRERSLQNLEDYSEASPVLVYENNGAALVYDEERFARIRKELGL